MSLTVEESDRRPGLPAVIFAEVQHIILIEERSPSFQQPRGSYFWWHKGFCPN